MNTPKGREWYNIELKIRADKGQFEFINNFNMTANHAFGSLSIQYEVKLILIMIVKRKIEFFFTLVKIVKQSLGVSGVISRITLLVIINNFSCTKHSSY